MELPSLPAMRGIGATRYLFANVYAILVVSLISSGLVRAQSETSSESTSSTMSLPSPSLTVDSPLGDPTGGTTISTSSALTTVVDIFGLNIRGDEERGLAYTLFHRDTGEIIAVDNSATTFVVTVTTTDLRTQTFTSTVSEPESSGASPSLTRSTRSPVFGGNRTAHPSTITQGAGTFLFTGSNYGPDMTLVNHCRLNGTTWATCSMTHVGKGWYTRKSPDFDGAWSTANFTWTSGGRGGFAPVTITAGVEKLAGVQPATESSSGAGGMPFGVMLDEARVLAWTAAAFGTLIVGVFAAV